MGQTLLLAAHVKDMEALDALLNEYQKALFNIYKVPSDNEVFMLLERQPESTVTADELHNLLRFDFSHSATDFMLYTSGRIFHKLGELRWEKQRDTVLVVYTGDDESKPPIQATETLLLDFCKPVFRKYFLFGKRLDEKQQQRIGLPVQDNVFAEVRIPRLLSYPAPEGALRVQILICEYIDRATGVNVAFRFVDRVGAR